MSEPDQKWFENATEVELSRLRHDMMGPLCNIRAYTEEIRYIGSVLEAALKENQSLIPGQMIETLSKLNSEDFPVCTGALDRAADELEAKISALLI